MVDFSTYTKIVKSIIILDVKGLWLTRKHSSHLLFAYSIWAFEIKREKTLSHLKMSCYFNSFIKARLTI